MINIGFAKYYEDNMGKSIERLETRGQEIHYIGGYEKHTYSNYADPHEDYYKNTGSSNDYFNSKGFHEKTVKRFEEDIHAKEVYISKLNSINIRQMLVKRSYPLRSSLMIEAIRRYSSELNEAKCLTENSIALRDREFLASERAYEKDEIMEWKRVFIYQLIDNALLFLSRIEEDNVTEIQMLCDDIKVLINWSNSMEEELIFFPCTQYELFNYLHRMKFKRFDLKCHNCSTNYIGQTNYCLKCYELRR